MSDLDRLKQRPEDRFKAPVHQFDLEETGGRIAAAVVTGTAKHKHETLYKHGAVTVALFVFEKGAGLSEHVAAGVVTVQVISGRLRMAAQGDSHVLNAGQMLIMAPGVRHDVQAEEESRMLLTVCLAS